MKTVAEIERDIQELPASGVAELSAWLAEYDAKVWDEQIERDARPGGPLDKLARKAIEDFHAGRTTELP
jgi:hypothetical protein